jgi:Flp pilus assembly protein TadD
MIHSDMGVFLTNQGLFEEALSELEKALIHNENLSGVYNNWGYYYYKLHDHHNSAIYYRKAIELDPQNCGYYNNLGLTLWDAGRRNEAVFAFQKSMAINPNQPKLESFLKRYGTDQQ